MQESEQTKLYREPNGVYLLVFTGNGLSAGDMYDCIGELHYPGDVGHPVLASSQVSPDYLRHRCKRVTWDELPETWRQAFKPYLEVS